MSFWTLRKRIPSRAVVGSQGGYAIAPPAGDDSTAEVRLAGFYHYHQGDVFTPGAQNFALDPAYDWPIQLDNGNGVFRNAFAFRPTSPQTIHTTIAPPYEALRGMIVGGISLEHLQPVEGQARESFNG